MSRKDRYQVIPSRVWKGPEGRTASIYGAMPWTKPAEKPLWCIVQQGWTVLDLVRGTVGIGRQPWPTQELAQQWVDAPTPS